MERKLFVGDVVKLTLPCLDNPAGTLGVVYEEYDLGAGPGVSIIFKNGNYDGFAVDEQEVFVTKLSCDEKCAGYVFQNVIKLNVDYRGGFFDEALGRTEDDIEQFRRLC